MSRTVLFLSLAASLALAALVATGAPQPPPPSAPPVAQRSAIPSPPVAPPAPQLPYPPLSARDGALALEAKLSSTYLAQGSSEVWLEANVEAASRKAVPQRVPVNLALVLDRSGSMSGEKLSEAKRAARTLVELLGPADRLAIVDFGSDVRTLESQRSDLQGKARLLAFIEEVHENGGTNIAGALGAAAALVEPLASDFKASRLILLSDGQPTEGVVDAPTLCSRVAALREKGLTVSALGVGVDFNGSLMSELSEQGGGFYGFIDDPRRLAEILGRELNEAAGAVARQVALELQLPEGVELGEVYGRTVRKEGARWWVPLRDFSPGQTARITLGLTVRTGAAEGTRLEVASVLLRYVDLLKEAPVASGGTLLATVSRDERQLRAVDPLVDQNAKRALAARQLTLAAADYEGGDREGAFSKLTNIRRLFGASADALAGEDLNAMEQRWQSSHSAKDVRFEAKSLQRKAMKGFGENNTY